MRPVVRDLALECVRRPPKLGAPDLAGAPRGTPDGGCDAAAELHQRAVVLGRDPMRREAGEMKHAPEAVAGRPEAVSRRRRLDARVQTAEHDDEILSEDVI